MPVLFRFHYKLQGPHTHVRLFSGKGQNSLEKCGYLVFRNEEWNAFRKEIERAITGGSGGVGTCIEFMHESAGNVGEAIMKTQRGPKVLNEPKNEDTK